jgi:hypothetical protein
MRQIVFTFALVLASGLAMLAQDTGSSSQQSGAQGTNPTAGSSSTASPSSSGPESGSMGQSSSSTASTKGEKKLKGCIESQGGQYTLQEKKGKQVKLTGSADLASHVGHQVTVHGTYAGSGSGAAGNSGADKMPSSSGSTSANPSSSSSGGEQEFMVTKIDHESDTCKIKGASSGKSGMSGSNNSGTQAPDHQ